MSWANFLTFTAACTLIVIDVCTEIGNCDRLGRTILLTFFTADTAKLAGNCNCLTFCVGAAGYTCLFVIWYQLDQVTRTFGNTFATGFTCFLIYDRNTIHYMDRIKWTCLYTASEAHTSKCTVFCTAARDESHHLAVFHTCVLIFHSRLITGSRTFYKSNLTCGFFYFLSHDRANLGCNRSTANRTLIYRSFSLCNCGSESGTSRISTTTTVIFWKNAENGLFLFIYLNG